MSEIERKTPIRLSKSSVGALEKDAVARVLDAGYLGIGEETRLFEEELCQYIGNQREVICVNTGTSALHLSLECLGVGYGDEVIVPSITYLASFQAIAATGAKAVACDVSLETGFLCVDDARKRVSSSTKAIMPVHYASHSKGLTEVYDFARESGLRVVEDAAHAFGCIDNDSKVGALGDVVCFSFDGIKNITCGEGGAIVTGDKQLAQRLRDARLLGVERDTEKRFEGKRSWSFEVRNKGFRYHLSNIMAAIGRVQLERIDTFSKVRRRCAISYARLLAPIEGVRLMDFDYEGVIPHIFVVRVTEGQRDGLASYLRQNNIECGIHYQANHRLDLFKTTYELPKSELLADEALTLPLHAELQEEDVLYIVRKVQEYFDSK